MVVGVDGSRNADLPAATLHQCTSTPDKGEGAGCRYMTLSRPTAWVHGHMQTGGARFHPSKTKAVPSLRLYSGGAHGELLALWRASG